MNKNDFVPDYNGLDIVEANERWEKADASWNLRPVECKICGEVFPRDRMIFTRDCYGVPFRIACRPCYEEAMEGGYDGEHYGREEL